MKKKIKKLIISSIFVFLFILYLFIVFLLPSYKLYIHISYGVINIIFILLIDFENKANDKSIEKIISKYLINKNNVLPVSKDLYIVIYDNDFNIISMSKNFHKYNLYKPNNKINELFPGITEILCEDKLKDEISYKEHRFEISKPENENIIFFKDITTLYKLKTTQEEDAYVVGLISLDNADSYNEDEEYVNDLSYYRNLLVLYLKEHHISYRMLRNYNYYLTCSKKKLDALIEDRFSILKKIKNAENNQKHNITLSVGLAYGINDFEKLNVLAEELLETAKERGGDQVVLKHIDQETSYFGGTSEAKNTKGRTKQRMIYNSLANILNKHQKVIIFLHKDADSDCVGAALGFARICKTLNIQHHILLDETSIDRMIFDVIKQNKEELYQNFNFVSKDEVYDYIEADSLFVLVDHNDATQSNGEDLLSMKNKVVIIDHHRRNKDINVNVIFHYIDAAASSTSELIVEMFRYVPKTINLEKVEANIMYLGLLIDTNHFKNRTSSYTFEVAKTLKQKGADPLVCESYINEPYEYVVQRSKIIQNSYKLNECIVVSVNSDEFINRTIASQASDQLLAVVGIKASFVLVYTSDRNVVVSARSNGEINVSKILEPMKGGGHLVAAGVQKSDSDIHDVYNELVECINKYMKENEDESNNA